MEIIKHGRPEMLQKMKGKCRSCKTVIECRLDECVKNDDSLQLKRGWWRIKCPVCETTWIYPKSK